MARIKRQNRKIHGQIQKFFKERLEKRADVGDQLHGDWEGCRRAHVCDDKYRVIWRDLPETADDAGAEGDAVVHVEVLRVGPKVQIAGGTLYEQPRPPDT